MTANYNDYPQTIGEIRSDKTQKSKDWTVRDALIYLLREIDSGAMCADKAIICVSLVNPEDDEPEGRHTVYAGDFGRYEKIGMIETLKDDILE